MTLTQANNTNCLSIIQPIILMLFPVPDHRRKPCQNHNHNSIYSMQSHKVPCTRKKTHEQPLHILKQKRRRGTPTQGMMHVYRTRKEYTQNIKNDLCVAYPTLETQIVYCTDPEVDKRCELKRNVLRC